MLKKLSLKSCEITEIPNESGGLRNLEKLLLNYNFICEIPKSFNNLKKLRKVNFIKNKINSKSLINLCKLPKLCNVNINYNNIYNMIEDIIDLPNLAKIVGFPTMNNILVKNNKMLIANFDRKILNNLHKQLKNITHLIVCCVDYELRNEIIFDNLPMTLTHLTINYSYCFLDNLHNVEYLHLSYCYFSLSNLPITLRELKIDVLENKSLLNNMRIPYGTKVTIGKYAEQN